MKRSTLVCIIKIAGMVILIEAIVYLYRSTSPKIIITDKPAVVDTVKASEWTVHTAIQPEDSGKVLMVTYTQKYGPAISLYCMAIFENGPQKKYRCVAPWIEKHEMERANINDLQVTKIPSHLMVEVP